MTVRPFVHRRTRSAGAALRTIWVVALLPLFPEVRPARGQTADAPSLAPAEVVPVEVAPAGAVAEFEKTRESQRQMTDRALATMTPLDVRHMGQVMRMRMEG